MTSGTAIVQVGVVVIAVLGLWIGARALVDATVRVARRFGVGELTIGLTIVAMGTSTPELVVTVDAALAGLGEIGVGNIIGSNAYNLAFILGGAVSLLRVIPVERSLVHRDGAALVLSTLVGAAALFDRTVTGVEGALLAGLFVAYTAYLVRDERTARSIDTEYADSRVTGAIPDGLGARPRRAAAARRRAGPRLGQRALHGRGGVNARAIGRGLGLGDRRDDRRGGDVDAGTLAVSRRRDATGSRRDVRGKRRREQRVQRARNYGDRGLPPAARGRRRGNRDGPLADSRQVVVMVVALWSGRRLSPALRAPSSSAPR